MISFKKLIGQIIMHQNCLDVAFWVSNSTSNSLIGKWINLGYTGNPWVLEEQSDAVPASLGNWYVITAQSDRARKESGLPFGNIINVNEFLSQRR